MIHPFSRLFYKTKPRNLTRGQKQRLNFEAFIDKFERMISLLYKI